MMRPWPTGDCRAIVNTLHKSDDDYDDDDDKCLGKHLDYSNFLIHRHKVPNKNRAVVVYATMT
jgi:hypothetical protein